MASTEKDKEPPPPEEPASTKVLDLTGSGLTVSLYTLCQVTKALKFLEPDQSIELKTDSYTGLRHDIQAWGRLTGNTVHQVPDEQTSCDHYIITKRRPHDQHAAKQERLSIIISEEGLLDLVSPLGFALAAASADMEVNVFFQGPAVRVLQKNFLGQMPGWNRPFSVFARRGMAAVGHDPPAKKLQELHDLGAKFYVCHPSLDHFGVKEENLAFDDVILSEYMTFLEAMRGSTVQMYP